MRRMLSLVALLLISFVAIGQGANPPADRQPIAKPAASSLTGKGRLDFNHDSTGFPLDGAHQRARCESCHVQGLFRGTPKTCNTCHTVGKVWSTVVVQNPGHISVPASVACDTCHVSTTSFGVWRMDHSATSALCSTCHNGQNFEGVVPTTKPLTHPRTTADCSLCHQTSPQTTQFRSVPLQLSGANSAAWGIPLGSGVGFGLNVKYYDHTGVTGNCASCHNGTTAQGKPVGHIPTSLPCEQCHTTIPVQTAAPTSFQLYRMDHTGITSGCATCHNGQTFQGVTPMSKPAGHLPTTGACELCHTNTTIPGGFAWVKGGAGMNPHNPPPPGYPTLANNCLSCHNGSIATGQIAGHIATNSGTQCDKCHSSSAASFATFTMDHSVVSTACSNCHATGKTFPGATMVTQPTGTAHIPTAAQCSTCHSSTAVPGGFATWSMNHTGITTGCATCHNTAATYPSVVTKPASGHIPTSKSCEACHTSTATPNGFQTWKMDHTGIATGCATCHDIGVSFTPWNGTPLVTKPVRHIPTTSACETCHPASQTNAGGFVLPITGMNHTGIVSNCSSCHNGSTFTNVTPMYKPTNHVLTTQDCSACHTNTTIPGGFAVATSSFDHVKAGVQAGTCNTCHNGTSATGMIGGHIGVNAGTQCDACHSYTQGSFSKWTMDHTKVSASCTSCHSTGNTFPGATMVTIGTVNHFPTTAQCSTCHSSTTVPGGFGTWTMDHRQVTGTACAACHDAGKSFAGATPVVTKPAGHIPVGSIACDQCHTSTTIPNGFRTWTMSHTAVNATPCSTCHNAGVSFTPWNGTPALVTKASVAKHIPTTAPCSQCHTSTTVPGGFAQWTMDHTGITSNCSNCHGTTVNTTFTNAVIVTKPSGHLATTADCVTCHTLTTPGGFATFTGTGGNPHTSGAPSTTCTNCHGNAAAVAPNAPAPGQPAGHITVNSGVQCGACHSDTAASFANWNRGNIHANVNTATCATCHAPGKIFPGIGTMVTSGSVTHMPITGDCALCHSTTTVPGGFRTWSMNHAGVTTTPCASCHGTATAGTFTNTSGTPIVTTASVTHIPGVSGDCSACHTSTAVTGGFATWTMNHTAVTFARCDTCHSIAAAASFTNHGLPIKTTASYPTHQNIGVLDCSSCHSGYTSFVTSTAAHNHTAADTGQCNACHTGSGGGKVQITGHIPTGALSCDAGGCHSYTSMSFADISSGNLPAMHTSLANNLCGQCHRDAGDQTIGSSPVALLKGKPSAHIPVPVNRCNNCHTAQSLGSFATFSMNHTTVSATPCATCHDATANYMASTPALVKKSSGASGHIPTTATCDQCHLSTTIPGGFQNTVMNHTAAAATPCASCHATGLAFSPWTGTALVTKSANHIPVGAAACDQCHASTTSFATWTMNHTTVSSAACATCHDTGKSFPGWIGTPTLVTKGSGAPNHIPTTQACSLCHTSTAVPGGFAQWTMNHAGIASNCSSCHASPANTSFTNAVIVTKPVGHMATTADCVTCHKSTNPGGFASFTNSTGGNPHTTANPGVCANCHGNASATAPYTPAPGMITGHIATTTTDCGACHGWSAASFAVWTMDHTKVSTTCATCHGPGKTFPGTTTVTTLSVTHIPITGDCNVCHSTTTVPGGFATWTMNHSGVTATPCATCHGAGKSFTNSAGTPLKTISSANHIPLTSGDCSNCHSTMTTGGFASWTMNHAYVNVSSCSACHGSGLTFTNTGSKVIVTKSATHLPTTSDCSVCHSGYVSFATSATSTNHTGFTTCNSCHTGQVFQGVTPVTKPSNHILTAADCSSCHANPGATPTVGGFKYPNWTMNHGAVTATPCANCHGIGKSFAMTTGTLVTQLATHFPTTGDCSVCHTSYTTFVIPSPYTGMVHAGGVNTGTCNGCHGTSSGITFGQGSITPAYAGLSPANHSGYPTNCQSCHTSFTVPGGFKVATFTHNSTATPSGGCYGCHGSGTNGAKMVITGHVPTGTISCDQCHSYSALSFATPIGMNHTVVAATACSTCHKTTGNQTIGSSSLATLVGKPSSHISILASADCKVCHTSQVTGGFASWTMNHSGVTTGTCLACHNGQSFPGLVPGYPAAAGTIVNKPSNHVTTTSGCNSCHGSTTTFKISGSSMNHAGIASGCQNCHAGQTFAGLVPGYPSASGTIVNKPSNHITTLAANTDCAVCHSSTSTFASWTMNHSGVSTTTCQNCHNNQSFQGLAPGSAKAAGIVVNKASNHITTNKDCNLCHSSTTTFAGGQMGTTQHTSNGNTASCNNCHNGQTFQGLSVGTATGSGVIVNKPSNHITTSIDCSICHSTSNFSTFAGTWTFGSSQHSSNGNSAANCIACHNGQTFANGVSPVNKTNTPSPGHVPTNADCSNCHTSTSTFASYSNLSGKHSTAYMPNYSSTGCTNCHGLTSALYYGVDYRDMHKHSGNPTTCQGCHSPTKSKWD